MKKLMVLLAAVLGLGACSKPSQNVLTPRPVVVAVAKLTPGAGQEPYSGEIRSRYEADLGFRIAGKIVERRVNLGDTVKKDQVLARLDPQDAQLSASAGAAQVIAAQADLGLAQVEYDRARQLYAQNFVSGTSVDTRRSQLDAAQARLDQARAQHDVSSHQVDYASLRANRDGVVTALPGEVGQVVAAGQTVVRIADPALREVLTWIPEGRASAVVLGQAAQIQIWGSPDKVYAGTIREIAAAADATTRTYAVRVAVSAPDERMRLGATAAVGFVGARASDEVVIPLGALMRTANSAQAQVWIVTSAGEVQARKVAVTGYLDDVARIATGLAPGEQVVVQGAFALSAGMRVRAISQQAPVVLDASR